ncbi:MAG: DUF3800 domain-containing protein [Caldilineales bacterium]|nr:DUF3800 domain-containing protein [Caldilineales bacterium]MCW5858128.1 DUF3800 domain-containing protein [Caldilineales bacterium]
MDSEVASPNAPASGVRHYFVDEAGDGNLFDRKGRLRFGEEGCSRYFILGVLDVPDPGRITQELDALRAQLLADPYFKKVPSMRPEARKTSLAFHAKDDIPEVRREVFAYLGKQAFRFLAVVRDKNAVADYAIQRREQDAGYRYHPNELYDYMTRSLFKGILHKDDAYVVHFSKRGAHDRTAALQASLEFARERFARRWGIQVNAALSVMAQMPPQNGGLQAVDYFLWSLQRFYERREDRYLEFLWPQFSLVQDLDDKREHPYGRYYTQKRPLTLAALDDVLPGI